MSSGQPDAPSSLGLAPLQNAPVLPGYYRVLILFQNDSFREIPCHFGLSSMHLRIRAQQRMDDDTQRGGMVRLEGAGFVLPYPEAFAFGGKHVEVSPFYLDRYEVSNSEFQEFLRATGRPIPRAWRDTSPENFGDLPAVGMSWGDAAAYAAWAGKRLPTLAEWLFAAGVAAGRRTPWAAMPSDDAPRGNVLASLFNGTLSEEDNWREYLLHTAPVKSFPEAATPEGIHNLYGNVYEWVETMAADVFDSASDTSPKDHPRTRVVTPSPQLRLIVGGAWDAAVRGETMTHLAQFGISDQHASCRVGFRCARSVTP